MILSGILIFGLLIFCFSSLGLFSGLCMFSSSFGSSFSSGFFGVVFFYGGSFLSFSGSGYIFYLGSGSFSY